MDRAVKYDFKKDRYTNGLVFFLGFLCFWIILRIFLSAEVFYKHNWGVSDVFSDYAIGWFWSIVFTFFIFLLPFRYKSFLLICWFLKILLVFVLDYFYKSHYATLDAYSYFANIQYANFPFKLFVGTYNITLLTKIFNSIFHSYRACLLVYAFIGMMGIYLLAITYEKIKGIKLINLELIALFFFPSVFFWSHILGKDPVTLFVFSVYFYGVYLLFFARKNLRGIVLIAISFFVFLFIRPWLPAIWNLALVLFIFRMRSYSNSIKFLILGIFFGFCVFISNKFNIKSLNDFFEVYMKLSQAWATGGSAQKISFSSYSDFILHFPWMAFSALFRPFPWEAHNAFQLFAGIENLFLLGVLGYYLLVLRKILKKVTPFHKLLLTHILAWLIVYSPICFQNLGTASRFKLQILPIRQKGDGRIMLDFLRDRPLCFSRVYVGRLYGNE